MDDVELAELLDGIDENSRVFLNEGQKRDLVAFLRSKNDKLAELVESLDKVGIIGSGRHSWCIALCNLGDGLEVGIEFHEF